MIKIDLLECRYSACLSVQLKRRETCLYNAV